MTSATKAVNPVHYPANPHKFEFDPSVAAIFPNMARRSIPDYERFHTLHAAVVADMFGHDGARMLDVGASHCAFYQHLFRHFWQGSGSVPKFDLVALDASDEMCKHAKLFFPNAEVVCGDIMDDDIRKQLLSRGRYDVINATYVLQFIPPDYQHVVIHQLSTMLKKGGILILGQKDASGATPLSDTLHRHYIQFRMDNGYSTEEIAAKTRALNGSMWPMPHSSLITTLGDLFRDVQPVTRTLMFNTLIAYK